MFLCPQKLTYHTLFCFCVSAFSISSQDNLDRSSTEHQLSIMSAGLSACVGNQPPQLVENSQETAVTPTQDSLLLLG